MIADVYTLDTTYRLQILDGTEWREYSQAEYASAADVHKLAKEIFGGLQPDEYRLIKISREVIENEPDRDEIGADGCGCSITAEMTSNGSWVEGTERTEHRSGCWAAKGYADATVCECNALIEEIDNGDGYTYWVHVKRMRIAYNHAAVPRKVVENRTGPAGSAHGKPDLRADENESAPSTEIEIGANVVTDDGHIGWIEAIDGDVATVLMDLRTELPGSPQRRYVPTETLMPAMTNQH